MKENTRILVVDDDRAVREAYRDILAPQDRDYLSEGERLFGGGEQTEKPVVAHYDVDDAGDGGTAIQKVRDAMAQARPFALAFVDMKMPGMNGTETARQIWRIDPNIKIMIVTAYSDVTPDEIIEVVDREDLFYLRKPFNPQEIRQFARALCQQWSLEQERNALAAELKQANLSLEAMNRGLEKKVKAQAEMLIQSEKMASLGILAAGVAHEINNPVSYIKGNLSAMKRYTAALTGLINRYEALRTEASGDKASMPASVVEEIQDFKMQNKIPYIMDDLPALLKESLEGVSRIETIVNDLRTFSRADQGTKVPVNINETLDAAINIIWNELKHKVEVIRDYGDIPPVSGYPQKLSQALVNILLNAAQAVTEAGTVRIAIREAGKPGQDDSCAEIEISDTGSGIAKQDVSRIFDPFFTTKPAGQGVGLGLYITYEIVQAHGGHIEVVSREGGGTTFVISLPISGGNTLIQGQAFQKPLDPGSESGVRG
ncbi:MAG: response regulator [Deltaproteobacteria bacterium]|nr:response regulator [Deltaproteobacteria bacterium]MCF8118724.1 response regulator [Deltaproteobacteria bacterium]